MEPPTQSFSTMKIDDTSDDIEMTLGDKQSAVSEEVLKFLGYDIEDIYMDNRQLDHIEDDKKEIIQFFDELLKSEYFTEQIKKRSLKVVEVCAFGSSATPLASHSGDLDLCIWLKNENEGKKDKFGKDRVLHLLYEYMCKTRLGAQTHSSKCWKPPIKIPSAKVPIIKAHIYNCDIDISVHIGEYKPPNTYAARLVQGYHLYNENYVPLCFYIKEWFKSVISYSQKGMSFAESVLPNSYTISLLVAQFMQDKRLLPNLFDLHPDLLKGEKDGCQEPAWALELIEEFQRGQKPIGVGELFYQFLEYMVNDVDLKNNALIVKSAKFVPIGSLKEVSPKHAFVIVDVFDKHNPARRVKSAEAFVDFLSEAKKRIEQSKNPARVTDRLFKMQIDFKLMDRKARLRNPPKIQKSENKTLNEKEEEGTQDSEEEKEASIPDTLAMDETEQKKKKAKKANQRKNERNRNHKFERRAKKMATGQISQQLEKVVEKD